MKKISIMLMVLVVALVSCKKTPEVNLKYVDVERDLVTVGTTTANIQCDYGYIATLKKAYLYYGEGENETNMTSSEMLVVQNTLYVELNGLKENTTYSYYYEFHNGFNSMRTALKTFKTETAFVVVTLPTVITAEVTEITTNSAKCGGEVTNDGGAEVTERGICWSMSANPTLTDHHLAVGSGTGSFSAVMDSLSDNITYHVRAYAINEKGTAYGLDKEFTTLQGGSSSDAPEGAINGLFTINENGDQVYFSKGNLQYDKMTGVWSFMENQYEYVEKAVFVGVDYVDYDFVGLFGWGTSGWDNGSMYYYPYNTGTQFGLGIYGPTDGMNFDYDLTGNYANADWGIYNSISNGGNVPNLWRTLSINEWDYIINGRSPASEIRYAKAEVNGIKGLVLLPDDWDNSFYVLNNANNASSSYLTNVIPIDKWTAMETYGAVFLPCAGLRYGATYAGNEEGSDGGFYWSTSCYNNFNAYIVNFSLECLIYDHVAKEEGHSVRLVQDANK